MMFSSRQPPTRGLPAENQSETLNVVYSFDRSKYAVIYSKEGIDRWFVQFHIEFSEATGWASSYDRQL